MVAHRDPDDQPENTSRTPAGPAGPPVDRGHGTACIPDGTAHAPRAWLEHFSPQKRSGVANLFHWGARHAGHTTPERLWLHVWQTAVRRQQWGRDAVTTAHLALLLDRLQTDRAGALAYAASVLAYEALPADARQRIKVERAFAYLKASMAGKEPTQAQISYLRSLGYGSEPPADRAEASTLIDHLKRGEALP
jgi:hypothetical protein